MGGWKERRTEPGFFQQLPLRGLQGVFPRLDQAPHRGQAEAFEAVLPLLKEEELLAVLHPRQHVDLVLLVEPQPAVQDLRFWFWGGGGKWVGQWVGGWISKQTTYRAVLGLDLVELAGAKGGGDDGDGLDGLRGVGGWVGGSKGEGENALVARTCAVRHGLPLNGATSTC